MGLLAILSAIESILGNDLVVQAVYFLLNEMHLAHGPEKMQTMFEAAKEMLAASIAASEAVTSLIGDYQVAEHHAQTIVAMAVAHNSATAKQTS